MSCLLFCFVWMLVFLNGATDASGAIAAAVSSGTLSMRRASILAAVGNALGGALAAVLFTGIGNAVADLADFGAFGKTGVFAVLLSTVLFTAFAWMLHLPTSESHALLAAAAGVHAALGEGGIGEALLPAVCWMTLCTAGGFIAGGAFARLLPRRLSDFAVRRLQIAAAFAASFFHGVQDLPKFLALLIAAGVSPSPFVWIAGVAVMSIGTLLGGKRMTEAVGAELADLTPRGALASDFAAAGTLFLLSVCGIPASTTHAKTAAVAGAGVRAEGCSLHRDQLCRFLAAWLLTFPLCAALGYGCARLLLFAL